MNKNAPSGQWPDEELMRAIKEGTRAAEAQGALYARYVKRARNLATRLIKDEDSAEDIVHDVLFAIFTRIKKTGPIDQFVPYLAWVISRECAKFPEKQTDETF